MRMRKLGAGQSVVFCVPDEIETKIRAVTAAPDERCMSVEDVLEWAIGGTWADIRRSMPLWTMQGTSFAKRKYFWDRARKNNGESLIYGEDGTEFLDDEASSIEARYRPRREKRDRVAGISADLDVLSQVLRRAGLQEGIQSYTGNLEEEQERELAPEVEQERHVEQPAPASPAGHSIHPDVRNFIKSGQIRQAAINGAFKWAFDVFKRTTASEYLDLDRFPRSLLVTRDFEKTIQETQTQGRCVDKYLRGAQWVITNGQRTGRVTTMVIVSPYEANQLIPKIEASKSVVLHLFAPRINQALRPLDHLKLYTIPSGLTQTVPGRMRVELMLFAGQSYFDSYDQYLEVCEFLCLAHETTSGRIAVQPDGFIDPESHPPERDPSTILEQSPVKFFKALTTRALGSGHGIEKTHLGRLLDGALLSEEDFENPHS